MSDAPWISGPPIEASEYHKVIRQLRKEKTERDALRDEVEALRDERDALVGTIELDGEDIERLKAQIQRLQRIDEAALAAVRRASKAESAIQRVRDVLPPIDQTMPHDYDGKRIQTVRLADILQALDGDDAAEAVLADDSTDAVMRKANIGLAKILTDALNQIDRVRIWAWGAATTDPNFWESDDAEMRINCGRQILRLLGEAPTCVCGAEEMWGDEVSTKTFGPGASGITHRREGTCE
jgi:septal ring factor EnvC (AmiA/AmiB activator)